MREIKFRAWDTINKKFIIDDEDDGFVVTPDGSIQTWNKNAETYMSSDRGRGAILLQYTGLKDKNSKEIYEGDIVKTKNKRIFEIEIPYIYFEIADGCWNTEIDFRVIGNIYENPELLEENKA